MTQTTPRPQTRSRRAALLGAVALGALGALAAPTLAQQQPQPVERPAEQGLLTMPQPGATVPSFADVVERVRPAVVSVRVRLGEDRVGPMARGPGGAIPGLPEGFELPDELRELFRRFGQGEGNGAPRMPRRGASQGSGFFISADGYLVTNNHVVQGAQTVEIVLDDGRTLQAEVVGTDEKTDLALLKADGGEDFPHVEFAEQPPRVGDWVVAIGNPFGLGGTVTAGIVSARGRDIGAGPYDDFLQIDAPVNRGNSGGPAFDQTGRVIGVNTAISSPTGGNVGIAFAIPSDTASRIVAQLRETGSVERGFLGVQIQPVTEDIAAGVGLEEARGAIVARVEPDSPAALAGVETGDIVLAVDGAPVESARDLSRRIAFLEPGREVTLSIWRDGARSEVSLAIGRMPTEVRAAGAERAPPRETQSTQVEGLGVRLAPTPGGGAGVAVVEVDPDGPAFEKGIAQGDVIAEVGGAPVSRPADVTRAIEEAREAGRPAVLMRVEREGASRFVAFRLPIG